MVMKYGMSPSLGLVNYEESSEEIFIGRDWGQAKQYSENTACVIDEEVKGIIDKCYKQARDIIEKNLHVLEASAQLLIQKEKISREEFEALFNIPAPVPADL